MAKSVAEGSKAGLDMLHGPLLGKIFMFALPLIAAGVLQQSFNAVDVAVVGRFAGSHALAAVGSNGPVISLIVNLFVGLSVGVNVVIANYVGSRNDSGVRAAVATSAVLALASGLVMLVAGLAVAGPILRALDTPEEVLPLAETYLRLYALGMPFMMIYNFGSAILRSVGDTRRPFYSLVAAGIVNVGLNFFFVLGLGMNVDGVAIATVISNAVNAAVIVLILVKEKSAVRLDLRAMRMAAKELRKIVAIGLPAGLQGMVFSVSNVFVLSAINSFGAACSAGSAVAVNFEFYCYFVISAFAQAAVAFTSQNYGAGNIERCRRIFRISLFWGTVVSAVCNLLMAWRHEAFIGLFTDDPSVAAYAATRMSWALAFQFIATSYEVSGACMRGIGYSATPMVLTVFGTCFVRLAWVFALPHLPWAGFRELIMIYPVTWIITGIMVTTAYFIVRRKAFALVSPPAAGRA